MVNLSTAKKKKSEFQAEIEKLKFEIERSEKLLANEGFVKKAPQNLIENEKQKLEKNKLALQKILGE